MESKIITKVFDKITYVILNKELFSWRGTTALPKEEQHLCRPFITLA